MLQSQRFSRFLNSQFSVASLVGVCLLVVLVGREAQAQVSTFIPLTLYDATFDGSGNQTGEIRVGIDVAIGGGDFNTYLFDTGSSPLVALNTVNIGSASVVQSSVGGGPVQNNTGINRYGASATNELAFTQYQGSVQLGDSSGPTINNISFAYGNSSSNPAIDSRFAGIMGVNLAAEQYQDQGTVEEHGNFDLFSMIGAVDTPLNTSPGFMISLKNPNRTPGVYIGLTSDIINQVQMAVAMTPNTSGPSTFPNSGNPTYGHNNFTVALEITDGVNTKTDSALPISMDTGAPGMFLRLDSASEVSDFIDATHTDYFKQGVTLDLEGTALSSFDPLNLIFETLLLADPHDISNQAEALEALRQVRVVGDPGDTHLNTGLEPFLHYDIVFSMDNTNGNVGYVGFIAIPEPSVGLILLISGAGLALRRTRPSHA